MNEQVVRVWKAEIGLSAVATEGEEMDCPDCWKRRRPLGIQKTLRPYSFRVQWAQVSALRTGANLGHPSRKLLNHRRLAGVISSLELGFFPSRLRGY
jgi:hypothetical protein